MEMWRVCFNIVFQTLKSGMKQNEDLNTAQKYFILQKCMFVYVNNIYVLLCFAHARTHNETYNTLRPCLTLQASVLQSGLAAQSMFSVI